MTDPITAHGWTLNRPTHGGVSLATDDGHFGASLVTMPAFDGTQDPAAAADGLARCVEDAALLAEARRLAAHAIGGVDIVDCAGSIANLLALLTGETTHDG